MKTTKYIFSIIAEKGGEKSQGWVENHLRGNGNLSSEILRKVEKSAEEFFGVDKVTVTGVISKVEE